MGLEVLGVEISPKQVKVIDSDDTPLPEMDSKARSSFKQGVEEPIKSSLMDDSHEVNEETKETYEVAATGLLKDAVDEWPAPKQTRTFYFVRFRPYEDPKLKEKIEQAVKDLKKKNQTRFEITEALKEKRSERANLISQLKPLTSENKRYKMVIDEKRKEMEPLTTALGKLRNMNGAGREKGVGICSSEEELDDLIHNLQYCIQHESNTLAAEKTLLKEIKQLEGTREKVIANAAMKAKIQDSLGQKEAIQGQVKLIGVDMDGVRKEKQTVMTKIEHLEKDLKAIDDRISYLQGELTAAIEKSDKAYVTHSELRKERDEANACFYQNRSLLNNAKVLAAKQNKAALEDLCCNEVEKFMSQWSSSKTFRDDYDRRILPSLDIRNLSRNGRMRNPGEEPIREAPSNEAEKEPLRMTTKQTKEDRVPSPQDDAVDTHKAQEEVKKSTEVEPRGKPDLPEDTEKTYEIGRSTELLKVNEIDSEKLKELRREEIAKAKLAMERKKKLAEKATAKAAARAQKEAEKKMKEKEKRAKKKSETLESAAFGEQAETEKEKTSELDEAEVKVDVPVPANKKEQRSKVNYRARATASDYVPKVLLKKKKSQLYWAWAVPAAILAVIFAVVGWYYFGRN